MTDEPTPQGGLHLSMAFGTRADAAPLRMPADLPFKLVIVGDFGGAAADGRPRDISAEDFAAVIAAIRPRVALEVANHLGGTPAALVVTVPVAAPRDLDPATLAARIPLIAEAGAAVVAARAGQSLAATDRERFAGLLADADGSAAVPRATQHPALPVSAPSAPQPDDGALDRLLDLIDLPDAPSAAAPSNPARAAVSAFIASTGQARAPKAAVPRGGTARIAAQVRAIADHPDWQAREAAWRSLRLLMTARERRPASHLFLCDVARDAVPDLLRSHAFTDALADQPELTAILVLSPYGAAARDLEALGRLAAAADRLATPVIVSLAADFFGTDPAEVAALDAPITLLDGPTFAAWRGLRERDESGFLFAAWNDVLLRAGNDDASALWGPAGVVVAAQVLRSLVRTGWPTEVAGPGAAVGGFDVAECRLRGGRTVAIPVRALATPDLARDLADAGIICLAGRPDHDEVFIVRAAAVHGPAAVTEETRKVFRGFNSLPFRFVSAVLEDALQANRDVFAAASTPEKTADAMRAVLHDMLLPTGAGASATVTAEADDRYEVSIRLGDGIMNGFAFSFEIAL
ncbi:type VI secretion system contractile sheath domain-containing protein [Segnochrobactrum spirostomi]|uniref:type VI secretion system contractile sheath domain-containing protein n=1 Tax=Segnochrobactrum spirostomi TaxID=2608987 RepID=UPI001AD81A4C|nr:type VI secretion system contractile sheath large subunit [Segnochrobactrum spirostomi]